MLRLAFALVLAAAVVAGSGAAGASDRPGIEGTADPAIVAVYPNPVEPGDAGEFVVVRFPLETDLHGWALADDDAAVPLPAVTVAGRVAFAADAGTASTLTDHPVVALPSRFRLANEGERLRLLRDGAVVDTAGYRNAPEGERRRRTADGWRWEPLGAARRPVVRAGPADARAFVLPDAPGVPLGVLRSARRRVLLAAYTLTSGRVAAALGAAARRGVRVRVLVEGGPVGGMARREARLLDALVAAGVRVEVLAGERARYAFHHAKYAVVDDRALVLTENWKPAGTGGHSSRGWGVAVRDPQVAAALAGTFRADAGWRDTVAWDEFRRGRSFRRDEAADGTYPSRFPARNVSVRSVRVLVAPDNAEPTMVALVDDADESVRVVQPSIDPDTPLLWAVLRAARRGVRVQILLSRAWYVREENRALAARLNRRAATESLPLEAKLARPRSRYGKIHAKGLVIDGERVILGSMNWNPHSARENREVVLVLEGEAVAGYYARVFRADWRGGAWRLPVGVGVAVLVGALVAARLARRVEFENG